MYDKGELVIYGGHGVCRIVEVAEGGKGDRRLYYTLRPEGQDCLIYTPVDGGKVFMRPLITADEALRLIDMIPTMSAVSCNEKVLSRLTQHYQTLIGSHECEDLIKLTMSIYVKKREAREQGKKFGQIDERFMKRAEDLLFGELGAALEIPRDQVSEYIARRVGAEVSGNDSESDR